MLGGVVAARAAWTSPVIIARSPGWPRRSATSRASCSASASGGASSSPAARASASPRRAWSASRRFFDRHGPKAILVGRFIGIVRAVAPFLAGASGMRLRDVPALEPARHVLWATAFTLVGYAFHASFATAAHTLTHAAFGAAVLAAAVLALRAHRQARAASA